MNHVYWLQERDIILGDVESAYPLELSLKAFWELYGTRTPWRFNGVSASWESIGQVRYRLVKKHPIQDPKSKTVRSMVIDAEIVKGVLGPAKDAITGEEVLPEDHQNRFQAPAPENTRVLLTDVWGSGRVRP